MDIASIIEQIFETILVFLMLGGIPFALVVLGLLVIAWKWNWLALVIASATAYAMLGAFWAWRAPLIETYNVQDQIYATYFLWGALFYLTLAVLLSVAIRAIRSIRAKKPLEQ